MLMGMLTSDQKQIASQFQNKTTQEQAEQISAKCNELGISKDQFTQIVQMLKNK